MFKEKYDTQFEDYRDTVKSEKAKFVNDKLSKIPIHNKLKNLDINNVMMDFDGIVYILPLKRMKIKCFLKNKLVSLLNRT